MRELKIINTLRKKEIPVKSLEEKTKDKFLKNELLRLMLLALLKKCDLCSYDAYLKIKELTDGLFEIYPNEVYTVLFYMEQEYLVDCYELSREDSDIKREVYKIERKGLEYFELIRKLYGERIGAYDIFINKV